MMTDNAIERAADNNLCTTLTWIWRLLAFDLMSSDFAYVNDLFW